MQNFAAIDIGSNAVRLQISSSLADKLHPSFNQQCFIRCPIRLGQDSFEHRKISVGLQDILIKSLLSFSYLIEIFDVKAVKAAATSAMREAQNSAEVLLRIKAETGLDVELISPKQEAKMTAEAVASKLLNLDDDKLHCDIGGGSIELSVCRGEELLDSESFLVGTVRLAKDWVKDYDWQKLKDWLVKQDQKYALKSMFGTGGSLLTLLRMMNEVKQPKTDMLTSENIGWLQTTIQPLTNEQIMQRFNLEKDRADLMNAASKIISVVFQQLSLNELKVLQIGLLDALLIDAFNLYQARL